jgi:aspartyl-tRNA(Asn)/glutamyl-tRNA(Gln) amidotransferase subunit A
VTGLRPTYGLVSRHGAMALSWTLDKLGVLAHTAEDCGLVLHVIAGKDSDDPGSAGKSFYYTPDWYQKITDLKVGYAEIDFSDWVDEPLRPVFANALSVVKSMKPQLVEMKLPDFPYFAAIGAIIDSEAASVFESLIRSGQVNALADESQIAGLKASLNYSAVDYLKAMRVRSQIQDAFRKLFADVDLLLAPTYFTLPERSDQPFDETPRKHPEQHGVGFGLIPATNLCGLPALTVPCGFVNGLPIGLQIVGPPFTENRLIAFAREFQRRTDFHKQHPPPPTVSQRLTLQ